MKGTRVKISILVASLLMTGCRIGAAVFEGGDVISSSGIRHCFEGSTCEFQVNNTNFSESFTAQPRTGYEFTKWRAGVRFLCANSTNPTCTVSNMGTEGNAAVEALVASENMFYLMPEFTCVIEECPLRPDPNWRALDEALVALEDSRKLIDAYVSENAGYGAPSANVYGINLATRNSNMLSSLSVSPDNASGHDVVFHITAHVYRSVWEGGYPNTTSGFSLSGETNADSTITWNCIPRRPGESYVPNGPNAIPEAYLPVNCRG